MTYFSPYGYPMQNNGPQSFMPPPTMQQMGQTMQTAQSGPVVLYVPNLAQVKEVDMRGIQKAFVVVQNEPVVAMRTADNMGLTSTEYFRLTKFNPDAETPAPDYVTRREFEAFVASLTAQPAAKKEAAE